MFRRSLWLLVLSADAVLTTGCGRGSFELLPEVDAAGRAGDASGIDGNFFDAAMREDAARSERTAMDAARSERPAMDATVSGDGSRNADGSASWDGGTASDAGQDECATVIDVAVMGESTCAVLETGRALCWGANLYGQLGQGDRIARSAPVEVAVGAQVTRITAGEDQVFAHGTTTLHAWGRNDSGELGLGDEEERLGPVLHPHGPFTDLAAWTKFGCGIDIGGTLSCFGNGDLFRNGLGYDVAAPTAVSTEASGFTGVAAGGGHGCAVANDGSLWCWGRNDLGQLGLGRLTSATMGEPPTQIESDTDWAEVTVGNVHSCATRGDGSLWCAGDNDNGQLGTRLGDPDCTSTPSAHCTTFGPVAGPGPWRVVESGEDHICGIQQDGSLWCWGDNDAGETGTGSMDGRVDAPTPVGAATDWTQVGAGKGHTCGVRGAGALWCWGDNTSGQIGIGGEDPQVRLPTQICIPAA